MKTEQIEWTCTDPDTQQYGRQLSEKVFEFKENDAQEIIELTEYTDIEIEDIINAYGYTLARFDKKGMVNIELEYGDKANWIIAECIFESGEF